MKARGIVLTVTVLLVGLFAILNWGALFEPVDVNLLLGRIRIPLGITLLLLALGLAVVFFLLSLLERSRQLQQVTHQERVIEDMQSRLDLARSKEFEALQSAFREHMDEVRRQMETDSGRLETNVGNQLNGLEERLMERLETVQERVVLVRNELAADIGELEDRLLRTDPSGSEIVG